MRYVFVGEVECCAVCAGASSGCGWALSGEDLEPLHSSDLNVGYSILH